MKRETMTVKETAELLGCSPQAVREHIRQGIWKFGEVIPASRTGKKCDRFMIYTRKLYKHIGMEVER